MSLYGLIKPLGILTYCSLIITFLSGILFFKFHVRWLNIKWHIRLGVITVMLATIHFLLVMLSNL